MARVIGSVVLSRRARMDARDDVVFAGVLWAVPISLLFFTGIEIKVGLEL